MKKKKRVAKQQDKDDVYLVEKVVDKKQLGRKLMYFVKWEGYSSQDNTWEPTANLSNVKHLIKEYNVRQEMNVNQDASTCSNTLVPATDSEIA